MGIGSLKPSKKKTTAESLRRSTRRGRQKGRLLAGSAVLLRLLLPVLLGGCACYYIVTSDSLAISVIRTSGCNLIDCDKIAARAGIVPGRNIFFADVARATRFLEEDPWIYRAVVKRILPDTIEIQVEERRAAAVLQLDTDCLVDTHGDVFYCSENHEAGLPLISGLTREYALANGEKAAALVDSALELLNGLGQRKLAETGSPVRICIEPSVGLTIDDNGTQIFMGSDGFEEKLKLLAFIRGDLALKGLTPRSMHLGSGRQAAVTLQVPEPEKNGAKTGKKQAERLHTNVFLKRG